MNRIALDKLDSDSESISSDDLENIIDSMEDSGEIEKDEADMLQKVLDLSTIDVKNIMTPRVDTIVLDIDAPLDEVRKCFFDNQYSRVPVYEGTIDHIVGIYTNDEQSTNPALIPDKARSNSGAYSLKRIEFCQMIPSDE